MTILTDKFQVNIQYRDLEEAICEMITLINRSDSAAVVYFTKQDIETFDLGNISNIEIN